MKKTLASYLKKDGSWEPQRDVLMHPLEQAYFKKEQEANGLVSSLGEPLSKEEEHELLINEGVDFVRDKRRDREAKFNAMKPQLDKLQKDHDEAHLKWQEHSILCKEHGHDRDTFDGDATLKLAKK